MMNKKAKWGIFGPRPVLQRNRLIGNAQTAYMLVHAIAFKNLDTGAKDISERFKISEILTVPTKNTSR